MTDYEKYRGNCREYVDKAIEENPTLIAVRGYYMCPFWGKQPHWWCTDKEGNIIDPTINQFPKPHIGEYVPFNGIIDCDNCGKQIKEEDAHFHGNYAFCSTACNMRFVGL